MSVALVPYNPAVADALFRRRGLLSELQSTVRRLEREYERDVERVREFERRYRPAVGERYDELEKLRERIDRAWESLGRAREGGAEEAVGNEDDVETRADTAPRPGDGARRLFLALARQVHPDLAEDDEERSRRHDVMAEATLAYRDNDERRLQWLLEHWQAESEPILGFGAGSQWSRTNRQIAWARYRIRELRHAAGQLHASPVARLMEQHERASTHGRNLIREMRSQILAELEEAYRDLERVREAIDDLGPELGTSVRAEAEI